MKRITLLTLLILLSFVGHSFAQEVATSTPLTEGSAVRPTVPDALQKAMTKVPTSYDLADIVIDYRQKFVTVNVVVYDQRGEYLTNTAVKITGTDYDKIVTPDFLKLVQFLSFSNIGK